MITPLNIRRSTRSNVIDILILVETLSPHKRAGVSVSLPKHEAAMRIGFS